LTLERDLDLMIRDSLLQTLDSDSQLFVAPHASLQLDKPYSGILPSVNRSRRGRGSPEGKQ
jgi:hypothetical protein